MFGCNGESMTEWIIVYLHVWESDIGTKGMDDMEKEGERQTQNLEK